MKAKTIVDTSLLLKRMKAYEEVTGKSVSGSLRRGARLLAVNLAYNTPPYGKSPDAKKLGEGAIGKDLLRIFYVMSAANVEKFLEFWGKKRTFAFGHKGAAPIGDVTHQVLNSLELKAWHQSHRLPSGRTRHIRGKNELNVTTTTGIRFRDLPGLDVGIVTKEQFDNYLKYVQTRVGLSKAAWAACALKIRADVKNPLAGIPAWVKRHVDKAPCSVDDQSESGKPEMTLTAKLPWSANLNRGGFYAEAVRITREKFYKSMGREIREALKKAREAHA